MSVVRAVLVLSACIVVRAIRQQVNDDDEVLERNRQNEFVDTHPPKETCTEFDEEVKRLNLSTPTGLGLDLLCAEWPVDKWGPFPSMNTTKAIEEFVNDAGDYYDKFKELAHTVDKKFCWKHLGYANKIADAVKCPAMFHPEKLGEYELETPPDTEPNFWGHCEKRCDDMCGTDSKRFLFFWCKCPVNGSTVTVSRSVRRKSVKCPETSGDDKVMKWGSGCFTTCPAGTNRLNKRMPFCDTDCSAHSDFNTSCGWGCAKDKRYCADSTEKMSLYGVAAAIDVVAVATGNWEAIPMVYTLVGVVDLLYEVIVKLVHVLQAERKQVKGLPFLAAVSKFVQDIQNKSSDVNATVEETKDLTKKTVKIMMDLYHIMDKGHKKVGTVLILQKLFGKFHLKTFLAIYDTFKAYHKPLCPYSTDAPPMESTVDYDGVPPKATIEQ